MTAGARDNRQAVATCLRERGSVTPWRAMGFPVGIVDLATWFEKPD